MSRRSVVVFGGPGSGALVAESVAALSSAGHEIVLVGYLNDLLAGGAIGGKPVLGPFGSWRDLPKSFLFVAPLHKAKAMPDRVALVRDLNIPEHRWTTIIDPRSAVASDAAIGLGGFVGPFASVGPSANIGAHCVVRAGAHVSHDCRLGDFVFVGTSAVVCGFAALDEGAYIAPSATIRDSCRVGRYAVAGLGSIVTKDVPDFGVVKGSPARVD